MLVRDLFHHPVNLELMDGDSGRGVEGASGARGSGLSLALHLMEDFEGDICRPSLSESPVGVAANDCGAIAPLLDFASRSRPLMSSSERILARPPSGVHPGLVARRPFSINRSIFILLPMNLSLGQVES